MADYRLTRDELGTRALWNWRHLEQRTVTHARTIANSLRVEGNLAPRRLAEQIEQACRSSVLSGVAGARRATVPIAFQGLHAT